MKQVGRVLNKYSLGEKINISSFQHPTTTTWKKKKNINNFHFVVWAFSVFLNDRPPHIIFPQIVYYTGKQLIFLFLDLLLLLNVRLTVSTFQLHIGMLRVRKSFWTNNKQTKLHKTSQSWLVLLSLFCCKKKRRRNKNNNDVDPHFIWFRNAIYFIAVYIMEIFSW